jgi:hypothetical protein
VRSGEEMDSGAGGLTLPFAGRSGWFISADPVVEAAPRVREKRSFLAKSEQALLVAGSQGG